MVTLLPCSVTGLLGRE